MKKGFLGLAMAGMMTLSMGAASAAANPFADVPAEHWSYDAVSQLAKDGVIEGYGDGTFRGDKSITRYEMAQMTARAMSRQDLKDSDKALVDKLVAEYAAELKNLGVRVAELERNADKVKFDGFFRIRQENFGKQNKIDDTLKAYIEAYVHAAVDEHWTVESKHKITWDMKNDEGNDGTVKTSNIYSYGRYKDLAVKIGKFDTVDGYAYTHEDPMRGVQVKFGGKLKTQLSWGRIANPNNNFDADYGSVVLTYPLSKRANLYGALHHLQPLTTGRKNVGDATYNIGNIGFDTLLGNNFRFIALYARSNAETRLNRNGYFLELDYKRMQVQNPGSYMIMLRNFRVTDATAISSRYEAYTHGNHTSLMTTLQALMANDFNWKQTAEALFVHVNTLRYRYEKIQQVLEWEGSGMEMRTNLFAAVRAGAILDILDADEQIEEMLVAN
ncbi:S-layer homology domain-containing protein [Selenomonas sp. GACV-9]|uniref:helix-turn-helix domain-containing protein n=1 Tax=Selenomonas sp. GACV-9 TaxID=3158782 RepID=UPI0008EA7BC2|nr:S-layer homology domain-containing protein [Selenomonas ruminantium]